MKYSIGDIVYIGSGNGSYCTFAKCEIVDINNVYYKIKHLINYGSIWGRKFLYGEINNGLEDDAFDTFNEAKNKVYKDMRIKSDREFIELYFKRGS